MNIANAIAKVYVDNYDRYLKDVFPQAKKDMEECQIFDRLSATGITDPAELYRKSIMEYLREQ